MSIIQLCKFFLRSDGSHVKDDVNIVMHRGALRERDGLTFG